MKNLLASLILVFTATATGCVDPGPEVGPDVAPETEPETEPDPTPNPLPDPTPEPASAFLNWATRLGGNGYDLGRSVAVLEDGSSLLTGVFGGKIVVGAGGENRTTLEATGERDIFVARYDAAGELAWAKRAGGKQEDNAQTITTYADGSSVVTGSFSDTAVFGAGEAEETELVSAGGEDIFVARYNGDGTLAWAKRAGGPAHDRATSASLADDDTIIVAGTFGITGAAGATDANKAMAIFGSDEPRQTELAAASTSDVFLSKFDDRGNLVWATSPASGHTGNAHVAAFADGSCALVGSLQGPVAFGGAEPSETDVVSAGDEATFIARFDASGSLSWVRRAGGTGTSQPQAVAATQDGSVVVAGNFTATADFAAGEPEQTTITAVDTYDVFVARYTGSGTLSWAKAEGGRGVGRSVSLSTLADGSAVLFGTITSGAAIDATFGAGEAEETSLAAEQTGTHSFVARFDENGSLTKARLLGKVWILGGAALSDGASVVTGTFSKSLVLGAHEPAQSLLVSGGSNDIFVARFMR